MGKFSVLGIIFSLIAIISLLEACTPKIHKNFLTFFFDGVPQNDSINKVTDEEVKNDTYSTEIFQPESIVISSAYVVHSPYREKKCLSCHDENSKSELIMKLPDLCYSCHEDYSKKYKKVHGPVAGGYCTTCHNAHMSKEKKLLIRTGQLLCLYCHESKTVFRNEVHKDITDSECTLCHNPHGGEDRFILN